MGNSDEIEEVEGYPSEARVEWVGASHMRGHVVSSNKRMSEILIKWDGFMYNHRYDLTSAKKYIKVLSCKQEMPEMSK
jgi:hypothetical protein